MMEFNELNINQKNAVMHIDGPCMVLAGPGSGKTRVITYRIINMVINNNINPKNILAISFTKASSTEMKNRALKLSSEELYTTNFRIIDLYRVYEDPQPIYILKQIRSSTSKQNQEFLDKIIDKYSKKITNDMLNNYKGGHNLNLSSYFKDVFVQIVEDIQDNKYILDAIDSYLSTVR